MSRKLLSIKELIPNKMYDMIDNPYPNYLLYYVDDKGQLCSYDTVVKVKGISSMSYNEVICCEFYDPSIKN